eukprot:2682244-Prymnesium_polylepis.1
MHTPCAHAHALCPRTRPVPTHTPCAHAHALRAQEPLLLAGSIQRNLDPHGSFADSALWEALRLAGLESLVRRREPPCSTRTAATPLATPREPAATPIPLALISAAPTTLAEGPDGLWPFGSATLTLWPSPLTLA